MKLIFAFGIVLGLCGFIKSDPVCTYAVDTDQKYFCLMTGSNPAAVVTTIAGDHTSGNDASSVFRVRTSDAASNSVIGSVLNIFTNLDDLQIQKGGITSLAKSDFTSGKCKLTKFQLWKGGLTTTATELFQNCLNLVEVDLTGNQLETVMSSSFRSATTKLILADNKLNLSPGASTLFDAEGNLASLVHLNLSGNSISAIPTDFKFPSTKLTHLDMSNNKLTTIAETLFDTNVDLQVLNLHQNQLTAISANHFKKLTKLTSLRLGSNKIATIDNAAFSANTLLETLDLSENPLKILNADLIKNNVKLVNLAILNVEIANFTSDAFTALTSLEHLNISKNTISDFDNAQFEKNTKLKSFIASSNKFKTLRTDQFSKLVNLEVIDFSSNEIEAIQGSFFDNLKNLKTVKFANNKCTAADTNFENFTWNDATKEKFKTCFNNYSGAPAIIISNVLLVFVIALKFV